MLALAALSALSLLPADAASFSLAPDQVLVGTLSDYVTRAGDTLVDIARENDLGYGQLMSVNTGVDPWLPGEGQRITLPNLYFVPDGPRRGIVIDLAEQRLYYFPPDGRTIETYPIGVGVQGRETPLGTTRVVEKIVQPTWYPPPSIRKERPWLPAAVAPGPDNPLGEYALRLGWGTYLIHGTNKPYGVGRNVSHGCIRLYPEDIERLFHEVSAGTPVRVIDQEVRLAWIGEDLYLTVTPSKQQIEELSINEPITPMLPPDLTARVAETARTRGGRIDWSAVELVARQRPGIPLRITKR